MKKISHIRKTFIHQLSEYDCGIACLRSLLGYAGLPNHLTYLQEKFSWPVQGWSLLELRLTSERLGLKGRCVEMDMEHLKQSPNPCILYVTNRWGRGHFIVHYGVKNTHGVNNHIIGDPASHVYMATESELNEIWEGQSALYFDEFPAISKRKRGLPWKPLFILGVFPRQLWLVIPLLSIISTLLGIATSLTLEKGADLTLFGKKSIIIAVLALLLLIVLFKTFITYLRQRTLIMMNSVISEKLVSRIMISLTRNTTRLGKVPDIKIINSFFTEINRIQLAFYTIVSVMLAEGLIIVAMLSFLLYETPAIALMIISYLIALLYYTNYQLPAISYQYAHIQQLEHNVEYQIQSTIAYNAESSHVQKSGMPKLAEYNHRNYLENAKYAAFLTSKVRLFYELLGTLLVTATISCNIYHLYLHAISYNLFLATCIVSYLITTIGPKLGNAMVIISDAVEMTRKLNDRLVSEY